MTHGETHLAVRRLLRGTAYAEFMLTVHSVECPPGTVTVEWTVAHGAPPLILRARDPYLLLEQLRKFLARLPADDVPPELAAIGHAPRATTEGE